MKTLLATALVCLALAPAATSAQTANLSGDWNAKFTATRPGSTVLGLEEAHRSLKISPDEFDAVAEELAKTMDSMGIPEREKGEVLDAFAAHKGEVTEGHKALAGLLG